MKMSTIDEILASMPDDNVSATIDGVLVIDTNTRQITLPSSEFVFGVESDTHSERKYFMCSRYAGNQLDLASCFIRVNYRNANGETDTYLVDDVRVVEDNILFSWLLSKKVTIYRGQVQFVVCASRLGGNGSASVEWHTTVAKGTVLEGVEPDIDGIVAETDDALATLLATVTAQRENVIKEGATQVSAVQTAAKTAENASVDEIEAKGANTLASIPDDYTALGVAVNAIDRGTAPGIVCEVEGSSVFVSDASDKPVQNIRIFGKSTQDGVPSPENPVEIKSVDKPVVAVCGKNLAYSHVTRETTFTGNTISVTENKSEVILNGTATKLHSYGILRTRPLSVGSYTVSVYGLNVTNSSTDRIYVMDAETEKVLCNNIQDGKEKTFEITTEGTAVRLDFVFGEGSTYENRTVKVQVERGNVVTEYEPYKVAQVELTHTLPGIPVTSGGNYTDSDGQQWICDEVDLERGVYVQRIIKQTITDFSESSGYLKFGGFTEGNIWLRTNVLHATGLCDRFVYAVNGAKERFAALGSGAVYFVVSGELTLEEWRTRMAELAPTIMLALQKPIETPLSETELAAWRTLHTNKPNTAVLNDAGAHMAVAYIADTKLYIDNKIAALMSGK